MLGERDRRGKKRNCHRGRLPEQGANGRFLSGNSGGGRPKGSRNKIGEDFLKAMAEDFETHGEATIAKVRETKPEVYLRVVADLLPKELSLNRDPLEDLSDEQLHERLMKIRMLTDAGSGANGDGNVH